MSRRSLCAIVATLLAVVAGACVPPAEETTTPANFDPETVMGQIQDRGELLVGIAADRRPFGYTDATGEAAGVTTELGAYVAEALHVEPTFVTAPNDDLLTMIDEQEVDMAFPITTITEPLARKHSFTDPYWIAHQRVLGFGGAVSAEDLSGRQVCSFIDPETEVLLSNVDPGIEVITATQPTECLVHLTAGTPATASDAILLGLLQELESRADIDDVPTIGGDDLTTEGYGAVVIQDAPGFAEVVNNILERAKDDGTWERAVTTWLDGVEIAEPPELTVEEAAALYPASV